MQLKVISLNLYLGADVAEIFKGDCKEFPKTTQRFFDLVECTRYELRSKAMAKQIAKEKPQLIGLQEVFTYCSFPAKPQKDGSPIQYDIDLDFLTILRKDLKELGVHYDIVARNLNTDLVVPLQHKDGKLLQLSIKDYDVILAHSDVWTRQAVERRFEETQERLNLPTNCGDQWIRLYQGFCWVDALINGQAIRFINTHLIDSYAKPIGEKQAMEIVKALTPINASNPIPVVLVGDFNSDPMDDNKKMPYEVLTNAGFKDAELDLRSRGVDTCCQKPKLDNPTSNNDMRIDFIFYHGPFKTISYSCFGDKETDRILVPNENGEKRKIWPSDHAGVMATLQLK